MEIDIHPEEVLVYVHKKICTRILNAAFRNKRSRNKYSSAGKRIGKLHIHIMKYYTAVKINGLEFHVSTGIYL